MKPQRLALARLNRIRSVRVRATFGGIDRGHGLFREVLVGDDCLDHVWLPLRESDAVKGLEPGARLQAWADVHQYRRRDGSHDYTLCNLREVRAI